MVSSWNLVLDAVHVFETVDHVHILSFILYVYHKKNMSLFCLNPGANVVSTIRSHLRNRQAVSPLYVKHILSSIPWYEFQKH